MKIMHLMLACFYIDNYSYQENLLPKYHKKQGHDVEIVASLFTFDENGKGKWLPQADKYINENGIPVTRLDFKKGKISKTLRRYVGLEKELNRFSPDIIFIHGVQFSDINIVVKYLKKHKEVKVFADNHSDFSNSAKSFLSKTVQHGILWRKCAQKINPFVTKFYGVLPARVEFLKNMYKLPENKVELLVMGADDDIIQKALEPDVVDNKREEYGLSNEDIVIMTGGKIDSNKPQTILLMEAINSIDDPRVKLLVFGTVSKELKESFDEQLSDKVRFIGWKKSDEIYNEFAVADVVAFPGLHSVLWEQAVGMGKPCIFRRIEGFTHVDLGGNCMFFEDHTAESYCKVIKNAISNVDNLKESAQNKGLEMFSYDKIAKRSIGGN